MKSKISNEFLTNYLIVFLLSLLATVFAFLLLSFADNVISKSLVKNIYPAELIMEDDYTKIDAEPVVENGGGVQVINHNFEVVYSKGLNTLGTKKFSINEFTDFLVKSKEKGFRYHYDILYNPQGKFWLLVTFPTSIRLDVSLVYNKETISKDIKSVSVVFIAVLAFYLFLLGLFAIIFSRISSVGITKTIRKLCEGTKRLREGDYSARVNLKLTNEFADLQDTFNEMAEKIETEINLREQAEVSRKRMIMDISHDLKNPLSSVVGYTELCLKDYELFDKNHRNYLQIILKNSKRASGLLNDLFEYSKVESPEFVLNMVKTDVCEYLRQICGELLPMLEEANFNYSFDIPENSIFVMLDTNQMNRVLYNLTENTIKYNPKETKVSVKLYEEEGNIKIVFKDNGIGISSEDAINIFKPFVRADYSRNSQTGGTGLGLAIVNKIIQAHNGNISLITNVNKGCEFIITLPKNV